MAAEYKKGWRSLVAFGEGFLQRYVPGHYREFTLLERKPRRISAAPYRDRVVHHALCLVIEPIFERSFIFDSYACRRGKGTHRAVDRFSQFCRRNRYVLKADIRKYFPSIDHEILLEKIQRKIKCKDTLWLVRTIIEGSNPQEEVLQYFPGDDLFTPHRRRKGIPIGNLTSQFFANCYMNDLDHYAKEVLGCKCYIRYVDDLTVFDNDKKRLWEMKEEMEAFLAGERLKLHPQKTFVAPVSIGIDHLGYRVFPTYRRLRKDTSMAFVQKLGRMERLWQQGRLPREKLNASVQSWLGYAKHGDTYGLRKSLFGGPLLPGMPITLGFVLRA
ncbi:MAG: RNA-directed DNA polymerase [bacterium]